MASAAKRPAGKAAAAKNPFLAHALRVLSDPRVRDEIIKHGQSAIDAIQQWLARRPKSDGPSLADWWAERVGGRFGQKGLERREANLRAAVTALSADSPTLAAALRPVTKALDDVARLLQVAAALPFAKRKRAHMRIDDVLDDLETSLFDDTLQHVRTTPIGD